MCSRGKYNGAMPWKEKEKEEGKENAEEGGKAIESNVARAKGLTGNESKRKRLFHCTVSKINGGLRDTELAPW